MGDLIKIGIAGIAFVIGTMLLAPFIGFAVAYICGWFAKLVIGEHLVRGLGLLGIIIAKDQIPLLAGCLGWIGGFFKNSNFKWNDD